MSFFWGAVLLTGALLVAMFVVTAKKDDIPVEPTEGAVAA